MNWDNACSNIRQYITDQVHGNGLDDTDEARGKAFEQMTAWAWDRQTPNIAGQYSSEETQEALANLFNVV